LLPLTYYGSVILKFHDVLYSNVVSITFSLRNFIVWHFTSWLNINFTRMYKHPGESCFDITLPLFSINFTHVYVQTSGNVMFWYYNSVVYFRCLILISCLCTNILERHSNWKRISRWLLFQILIVWYVQPVPITTDVLSSNPAQARCTRYHIMR
jgi:hypothetical protein